MSDVVNRSEDEHHHSGHNQLSKVHQEVVWIDVHLILAQAVDLVRSYGENSKEAQTENVKLDI